MAIQPQDIVLQVSDIKELAKYMRARRKMMGLRQSDVADSADIALSRLSEIEHNEAVDGLGLKKLNSLLNALGLQIVVALQSDASPSPSNIAAHKRNAIRVPPGVKIRQSSIA
jgi:transcriptional regulator with XRE-family HTH domain